MSLEGLAMIPAAVAQDRAFLVPQDSIVRTGYVTIHQVRMGCRDRMAVGDVSAAYQKRLQFGAEQPFPCPNGYWEGDTFVIRDGRHEYIAALMLGFEQLLVAWVESEGA